MFATYKQSIEMHAKSAEFTTELQDLAALAKVLSHPARIAIIQLLSEQKTCVSGSIADSLPLSRATVCQHLQDLKNAGLIRGEISGQNVCYCLDSEQITRMKAIFSNFITQLDEPNHCDCL